MRLLGGDSYQCLRRRAARTAVERTTPEHGNSQRMGSWLPRLEEPTRVVCLMIWDHVRPAGLRGLAYIALPGPHSRTLGQHCVPASGPASDT
jgi:hypothetical protein